jgi:hypothetical protein
MSTDKGASPQGQGAAGQGVRTGGAITDLASPNELSPGRRSYLEKVKDGRLVSEPLVLSIRPQALNFGAPHAMAIPGYIIVRGKPPPVAPAKAQYRRQPTGGMPPYTYASSDEQVAQVDSEGLVTAAGNGTALISVRDCSAATAQFAITFSAIVQVAQHGPVNWGSSVNDRPWVNRALSVAEMRLFYDTYAPSAGDIEAYLGWRQVNEYWTSTNILTNAHGKTFLLRTGTESDKQGGARLLVVLKDL